MEQPTTAQRSWKEKQRQEREALILQTAEEVLQEKGYHETSMDEIAARVGIAKGTVYLHFPSKEDLVAAIFEREMQNFLQSVNTIAASTGTVRQRLDELLRYMYGGLFTRRFHLMATLYNTPAMKPLLEKKEHMHEIWDQLSESISALLDEGKAAGEFDTTIPTPVMVTLFVNLLTPGGYKRLVVEKGMSLEEVVAYLGQIYFKGISPAKS